MSQGLGRAKPRGRFARVDPDPGSEASALINKAQDLHSWAFLDQKHSAGARQA
jgi:hypothetical protein